MIKKEVILSIDTSNYTTSIAIVSKEEIIRDVRRVLDVPQGKRGLRQSDALFHHVKNLPDILEEAMSGLNASIVGVAASDKPRPVTTSYMPVFMAGVSMGKSIAAAMHLPFFTFSHQEGHIEAVAHGQQRPFRCFQLSGGTCELLCVRNEGIEIIGGSHDISFGQVLDRAGVAMGLKFPAGPLMDKIAVEVKPSCLLSKIKCSDNCCNLSGIETQFHRAWESVKTQAKEEHEALVAELFSKIAQSIIDITGNETTFLTGGVSSSKTLRKFLAKYDNIKFPIVGMGNDNAVGIGRLGGAKIWQ